MQTDMSSASEQELKQSVGQHSRQYFLRYSERCSERCLEQDLRLAVKEVQAGWSAAIVRKGVLLGRERGRGVRPALTLVRDHGEQHPFVLADKVLGLAAFRLGCLLGAKAMWGELASVLAVAEGRRRGIEVRYHRLVPAIMNDKRDGLCPMEQLAFRAHSDEEFLLALTERLR